MDKLINALGLPASVLRVDRHALDDEFEHHPQNLMTVSAALADAKLERDACKQTLVRIEGRVRREHRDQADGDRRITEKDIASRVANDPEVRKAERELSEAEHSVDTLFGMLSALQAKTSALKHLSELWQTGYYVTPTARPRQRNREG